ncbi:glycosyltransferase family 2 protein [Hyperthermus butylicus]|uniref:Glycosyltransferase n=1 Tax=Hyperthermus butylicus (strain DSM 5456 / JCM 9403 / PLM1-5) TaxID=415426 RepID=A2BKV6_HYPBU|nr:glycosyltransferase family 2 protein [Hyperthermus butylicus]ABM80617.1 putative glycosyltransferase [Hyperthermus butylicus DSM 5456]
MSADDRGYNDVTVVVPTLNEEKAIGAVIDELLSVGIPRERILVVDGYSTDRTREIAGSKGVRVVLQEGRGKAAAVKTALRYIDTPYTVLVDGDYTYPANYIPEMLEKARKGCDWVGGARVKAEPGAQSLIYKLGNRVLTRLFNLLFGTKLRDVLTGLYLVRTDVLHEVDFEFHGFSVESEIAAHMASQGYRVCEVPILYRRRLDPRKKLGILHGPQIARDMIRLAWRYNPAFLIFILGALLLAPGIALGGYVAYKYLVYGVKHHVKALIATTTMTLAGFNSPPGSAKPLPEEDGDKDYEETPGKDGLEHPEVQLRY